MNLSYAGEIATYRVVSHLAIDQAASLVEGQALAFVDEMSSDKTSFGGLPQNFTASPSETSSPVQSTRYADVARNMLDRLRYGGRRPVMQAQKSDDAIDEQYLSQLYG